MLLNAHNISLIKYKYNITLTEVNKYHKTDKQERHLSIEYCLWWTGGSCLKNVF